MESTNELFKKNFKEVYKIYNKKLTKIHKHSFESFDGPLEYFITYLEYMRDYYIFMNKQNEARYKVKLTSIILTLEEYNKYATCIAKYFNPTGGALNNMPVDEALKEYEAEILKHWQKFWALVSIGLPTWFELGD